MKQMIQISVLVFNSDGELFVKSKPRLGNGVDFLFEGPECEHAIVIQTYMQSTYGLSLERSEFIPSTARIPSTAGIPSTARIGTFTFSSCYGLESEKTYETALYFTQIDDHSLTYMSTKKLNELVGDIDENVCPWLRAIVNMFPNMYTNITTRQPNTTTVDLGNICRDDASLSTRHLMLEPFTYMRSIPGKGIRDKIVRFLGTYFNVPDTYIRQISRDIENLNCASLLLDDVQDGSTTRRGYPASHVVFGDALTINAGCYAMFKIIHDISQNYPISKQSKVYQIFLRTIVNSFHGQGTDIYWTSTNYIPTCTEYERMVDRETASLFKLAVSLAKCMGDDKETPELVDFFDTFALFFQIRDDYINAAHEEYWEKRGFFQDLDEGKYSYLVLILNQELQRHGDGHNFPVDFFNKGRKRENVTFEEKKGVYDLMMKYGVLDIVYDKLITLRTDLEHWGNTDSRMNECNKLIQLLYVKKAPRLIFSRH